MRSKRVPFLWTIVFLLCVGVTFACAAKRIRRGFFEDFGGFGDSSGFGGGGHEGNEVHHGGGGGGGGHRGNCEESRCGYNIRHCPHGCVFNSLQCGNSGASYDMCCCY